jgi:tetratricopeptide (TPR) repeat protein
MLCLEALGLRRNHPQLYLNLAEVYQTAGRPQEAIEVLEKRLASTGRDLRIRRAFNKLGSRRKPVLSFLHRSNAMNRNPRKVVPPFDGAASGGLGPLFHTLVRPPFGVDFGHGRAQLEAFWASWHSFLPSH